ncbi:MAG: hypothetical protein K2M44_07105 [Clostridia bacterium]|nr:hypothetical protein [Clostridia bacterium]
MTASELKYLLTANELSDNGSGAKMAAMAGRLKVSKVSVYRAVERLIVGGYIEQIGKRIHLTQKGLNNVAEYLIVIEFICDKLLRHCNTPKDKAFNEALGVACALSEESRKQVIVCAQRQASE